MILGVDIGGANLKFAAIDRVRGIETCHSRFFPMWTDARRLAEVLLAEFVSFGPIDALAITMTGEMADCFIDRHDGVGQIAEACRVSSQSFGIERMGFYGSNGRFLDQNEVGDHVDSVASANWHASASWLASELFIENGILIDIGSTTTDLIPVAKGEVLTKAKTDHDRLCEGSLVYLGCGRTPVCSLVTSLRIDEIDCPVMNEVFATIDDALIVLGETSPDAIDTQSADGQPRTVLMAENRIARMVGLDRKSVSKKIANQLAHQVVDAAKKQIAKSFEIVDCGGTIVMSGHCDALFKLPGDRNVIRIADGLASSNHAAYPH